ncbi:thiamine pyrophosphate-binding protein [Campylobacter concisus]|uniref:Acetolactate synthase n=1 Tax=Campylobacter concisus TaxID=199 RepID=A0A1Y5N8L1_9BACT|nr:thiamine pyrophosphate-binding protein [Campylobacter concisus]OUT17201.1 acetolactate synthase [Campylobacter concisus]QPH88221.1 thiamine pyrophosphate-binding protein [Campylobacter concisus]QPI03926.1 thiamine pyrophosphate-binding protein [Campylobacter concisus]
MIKVSDFIAKFIAEHKDTAKTVFMVSGGGNMHLIDSLGKNKNLEYVCNHHEQACAIAAEGYARVSNKIGIAYVTTGPGGTNAITGIYGAWVDSIPMMIISGQVKFQTTIVSQPELNLRQLGDQEVNIVDIVRPITKYTVMITDKNSIKFHLQKAVYEAKHGRPGPVWLDVPLDIQGAMVDEADLIEFEIPEEPKFDTKIPQILDALKVAERPVIIAGNGVTLAGANEDFLKLIKILKIPVISTFARYDIVRNDHELFFGRYGTIGNRAANFVVQNSDLIISIGARLNIRAVSYNWEFFGREAKKILVDIDQNELDKKTIAADIKIKSDAKVFISDLRSALKDKLDFGAWLEICKNYRKNYPTIEPFRQNVKEWVDSYNFFDVLSNNKRDLVYVFGNGTACVSSYQSLRIYENQKVVVNSGCASMGYDLPAAIGACFANGKKDTICVTGEGSLQMNIQEFQTIIHNKLPIKIFVLNNAGYISIRNTQNNFFKGHKVGSDKDSGVSFPDTVKLAQAYGFEACRIENQLNLKRELEEILSKPGAIVCEIMLSSTEKMEPKLSSKIKPDGKMISKPLEDMFPFLPREEFYKNMIIRPVDE